MNGTWWSAAILGLMRTVRLFCGLPGKANLSEIAHGRLFSVFASGLHGVTYAVVCFRNDLAVGKRDIGSLTATKIAVRHVWTILPLAARFASRR